MRAEEDLMRAIIEDEKIALRLKREEEEVSAECVDDFCRPCIAREMTCHDQPHDWQRLERERLERLTAEEALRQKSATKIQSLVRGNRDRAKFVVYSAVLRLQQAMHSTDQGRLSVSAIVDPAAET